MTELLLLVPLFLLFLVGILFFGRMFLVRIHLANAARYGGMLLVHPHYSPSQVQQELQNILGRTMERDRLEIRASDSNTGINSVEIIYRLPNPSPLLRSIGLKEEYQMRESFYTYRDPWYWSIPGSMGKSHS